MSGYQNYYSDGQSNNNNNSKSTINTSAYGDSTQTNYYNSYQQQQQQQQQYGSYDGYYYEGYDPSQYYNDPNAYYGEEYYQYGQDNTIGNNSVARYSHSFGEDGSTTATATNITTSGSGAVTAAAAAAGMDKKTMDGLTSAQRKKLAYYQYFGEEIPEHTTSGYTRADSQGVMKQSNIPISSSTPPPPSSSNNNNATIAAAPTVSGGGGKMKKNKNDKGGGSDHSNNKKKSQTMRFAAGEVWEDQSLAEWDDNDFRLFAGDLGNEVTDENLFKAFAKYPGCQKARVVRDKRSGKTRGYGFISFSDANDFVKAWREMNGKYVGNRPIKLRKSTWQERNIDTKMKKEKEKLGPYSKRR